MNHKFKIIRSAIFHFNFLRNTYNIGPYKSEYEYILYETIIHTK